jgi:hypothetical protein
VSRLNLRIFHTFACAVLFSSILVAAGSGTASAATTLGNPLAGDPLPNAPLFIVPVRNVDGSTYNGSAVAGVLTSVTIETSGDAGTVPVMFLRPAGPIGENQNFSKFADDLPIEVTADASAAGHQTTVATRIPIAVGDRLGASLAATGVKASENFDAASLDMCAYGFPAEPFPVGTTAALIVNGCQKWWPSVQGVVEADLDADGFGDESQDLCPTDATRQTACPPVVLPTLPANLTIKAKRSTAKLSTSAARVFVVTNSGGVATGPLTVKISASKAPSKLSIVKGCKPVAGSKKRRCSIAGLAPGESVTLKVSWTPRSALKATLTASVTTATAESSKSDNKAQTTVKAKLPK